MLLELRSAQEIPSRELQSLAPPYRILYMELTPEAVHEIKLALLDRVETCATMLAAHERDAERGDPGGAEGVAYWGEKLTNSRSALEQVGY